MDACTLYFSRYHTRGNLKGMTTHGRISFVDVARADGWIRAVRDKGERGQIPYRLVDATFQARRCDRA